MRNTHLPRDRTILSLIIAIFTLIFATTTARADTGRTSDDRPVGMTTGTSTTAYRPPRPATDLWRTSMKTVNTANGTGFHWRN